MTTSHLDPLTIVALGRGELSATREKLLARHLDQCPECADQVAAVSLLMAGRRARVVDRVEAAPRPAAGEAPGPGASPWSNEGASSARGLVARLGVAIVAFGLIGVLAFVFLDRYAPEGAPDRPSELRDANGTSAVASDPAARLVAAAGPDRLTTVEAQELLLHVSATRSLVGTLTPTDGRAARVHSSLVAGLDAVLDGRAAEAADVLALFRTREHFLGTPLLAISEYLARVDTPGIVEVLRSGTVAGGDPDSNSLVEVCYWLLGKELAARGDVEGALASWRRIAGSQGGSFASMAALAVEEADSRSE